MLCMVFIHEVKVYRKRTTLIKAGNEQVNFLKPNRHRAKRKLFELCLDVIFILNSAFTAVTSKIPAISYFTSR